jgi:hypothetical protein
MEISMSNLARKELMRLKTWEQVLASLETKDVIRRKSGVIILHCVFHTEKTPSLWLRPTGSYVCYGCHARGDMLDFVLHNKNLVDLHELVSFFGALPTLPSPGQAALFDN